MEKRRRARINASLTELKALLLDTIKKEGTRQNKMEKADILEMAVKHLRQVQRQQFTGESSCETPDTNKYQLGFHACVQEVCKYLDSNSDEDVELKTKLLNHLANCMTSASYPTAASTSSSSSCLLSSTAASSVVQVPLSPMSVGSSSPSSTIVSPEVKSNVRLESSIVTPTSVKVSQLARFDSAKSNLRLKGCIATSSTDADQRRGMHDGILHSVLTSSTPSIFMKPQIVSLSATGAFINPPTVSGGKHISDNQNTNNSNTGCSGSNQAPPVTEINNNSIILPAFVNVSTPTTFTCLQQPSQLQQTHVYQQQHHINQQQLLQQMQQQLLPSLPEGSSIFTSSNPFQLIPTKTANGDVAFLLSATNVMNPSQIPSFSVPVLAPPSVNHAQILASPIPQQAIQIAVSYPPDDQSQSVAFISNPIQPLIRSTNQNAEIIASSTPNVPHQTTPLNLSSTTHKAKHIPHRLMPKQAIALPNTSPGNSDHAPSPSERSSSVTNQTASFEGRPFYPPLIISNSHHAFNTGSNHQTYSPTYHIKDGSDPAFLTPPRPSGSFLSDLQKSGPASDTEELQVQKTVALTACQPQPSFFNIPPIETDKTFSDRNLFRPWKD